MQEEDYQFISDQVAQGMEPDEIANALTHHQALRAVQSVIREVEGRRYLAQEAAKRQYYLFYSPLPKPIRDESGGILQPSREMVRVLVSELSAFCKANRLDEHAMCRVALSEQEEHKGWKQCDSAATDCANGQPSYIQRQHLKEEEEINRMLREQERAESGWVFPIAQVQAIDPAKDWKTR